MPKIHPESRKQSLAVALAAGRTVADWADENGLPLSTAYRWAQSRAVVDRVEAIRRDVIHSAVGQLCQHTTAAIAEIARLIKESKSDAVRLSAARAVLAEMMAVANFATLEGRLAEVERKLHDGSRSPVPGPQQDEAAHPVGQPATGRSGEEDRPCAAY
jgi:hypothetical protein